MHKLTLILACALAIAGCTASPNVADADKLADQISDAEMRDEYHRIISSSRGEEYRIRHILLMTEEDGKDVLVRLASGEIFADVAKVVSRDRLSARNGGDLGWTASQVYGPEIEAAIEHHPSKGVLPVPVRSRYGWHVLEIVDTRPLTFPEFEEVKDEIRERMKRRIRALQAR